MICDVLSQKRTPILRRRSIFWTSVKNQRERYAPSRQVDAAAQFQLKELLAMAKTPIRTVFNVPTLDLSELPHSKFSAWKASAIGKALDPRARLTAMAKEIGSSRAGKLARIRYVLAAYETALSWEQSGDAMEMIFGAIYLADPLAFQQEVDIFSAALRLGIMGTECRFSIGRASRACKFAWLSDWSPCQFEQELLRADIPWVAKRWIEAFCAEPRDVPPRIDLAATIAASKATLQ